MKKFKRLVLEDPEHELDLDEEGEEEEEEEEEEEDEYEDEDDDDDDDEEEEEEDDDDEEEEDDEETDEETEPDDPPWRPTRRPAFRRSRAFGYDDDGDAEELTEEMAAAIRAGKYKPKRADPWTAHILYNALLDTGRL